MTVAVPDFFAATPARIAGSVLVCSPTVPIPAARPAGDDTTGAVEVQFRKGSDAVFVPARESRAAHPASPVGRTAARLAADPGAATPIHRLEERLGRPLVPLATLTDLELHALTDLILTEKQARTARWLGLVG